MKIGEFKKEIIDSLKKKDIVVNAVAVRRDRKDANKIKSVTVSLDDFSSGYNILYMVKTTLDDIEEKFDVIIMQRLIDF